MDDVEALRVLVVEDDTDLSRQITKILKRAFDVEVETADTCAGARRLLASRSFDVVTLDYMLPDGRGLELLEEFFEKDTPPWAIMVTGHGDEETAVRSFRESASGYVVKDAQMGLRLTEAMEKALAEIRLSRARRDLESSEARFRSLIENASDIITVLDGDWTVLFASPSAERLLGYPPSKLEGSRFTDYIHPQDIPALEDMLREASSSDGATIMGEFRFRHRDGPWRYLESLGRALGADRSVGALVLNSRDMTRRRLVESELEEYREHLESLVEERTAELQERAEQLADFLTVASHELRHPLSVIKGYATLLGACVEKEDLSGVGDIAGPLNTAVNRLTGHVEELMEAGLVEQGRFTFDRTVADLVGVVYQTVGEMRLLAPDREFPLRAPGSLEAVVDRARFRQLMVILLSNALKFSPAGSAVEVCVSSDGSRVTVQVMDRGIGVPEEDLERIFERFYQVEDTLHHSSVGLGLGLYLAGVICEAHGGSVRCLPREGGGSVFEVELPAGPPSG
ncbi:MAG: PAS domain S-box protein [Actinobacteria bacterium]|nr:PAS domain S-box protein [Actinomycetota bacterium]MBU1944783.1 PAS domain S-box protein [Actinomycetota bacterium]MBU2688874.1 PAS domain S-box protein [Actinomycetota bacterium]